MIKIEIKPRNSGKTNYIIEQCNLNEDSVCYVFNYSALKVLTHKIKNVYHYKDTTVGITRYKNIYFDECFLMLAEDEMASFIISANDFFTKTLETTLPAFIQKEDPMIVDIDVIDIQTEEEYFMEKEAFLYWIEDFGDYEKVILRQYIDQQKVDIEATESGLYHITLEEGNGEKVFIGDTVTVHYEGKFLNGKFFDSTKRRNSPFQFVYGRKWQVIEGMEEAIGRMIEGEKALFIIPSQIGFGETGSSTGIIPPYTSTLFEVELIEVIPGSREKDLDLNKYD